MRENLESPDQYRVLVSGSWLRRIYTDSNPGDVLTCCASHTILLYALSELSPRILLTPDDGPHRSVDHPDKNSCTSKVVCCSLADHAEPQTSALSGHSGAFDRPVWSKATVELLFLLSE